MTWVPCGPDDDEFRCVQDIGCSAIQIACKINFVSSWSVCSRTGNELSETHIFVQTLCFDRHVDTALVFPISTQKFISNSSLILINQQHRVQGVRIARTTTCKCQWALQY